MSEEQNKTEGKVQKVLLDNITHPFRTTVGTSITTAALTVIISLVGAGVWFQETMISSYKNTIDSNQKELAKQSKALERIEKEIKVARDELEENIKIYLDNNYGVLSKRDEKVEKIRFILKQQERRLTNIERALSKY